MTPVSPFAALLGLSPPAAPVKVDCARAESLGEFCVPGYQLQGQINTASVTAITSWIDAAVAAGAKAIVIEIDTPGGVIDDGTQLAKALEELDIPSYCIVDDEAYSMGFYILQSCTHRIMTKRSTLMAHAPSLGGNGGGDSQTLLNAVSSLIETGKAFAEHSAGRLNISVDQYLDKVSNGKEWYLAWKEALAVGAVDRVVVTCREIYERLRSNLAL